jgi:PAS domain S-box-containing protein
MVHSIFKHPLAKSRSWPVGYTVAILTTLAATMLRLALTPLIGAYTLSVTFFFAAVLVSAWYGGFRAALLSMVLSVAAAGYFFTYPPYSFHVLQPIDQISLSILVVVGLGIALFNNVQRRAELEERAQRHWFETTLASIGDGVIATDSGGHVTFMNAVAEAVTGWKAEEASGRPLEIVFNIVNEDTHEPVPNPALQIKQAGCSANLVDNSVLIARDGTEIPIDDSGSIIRDAEGRTLGRTLVFRDISQRRRLERERTVSMHAARQLAAIVESCDDAILGKNLDLCITSWNRAAEEMFGYSAGEVIGRSVRLIIPENRLGEEEGVMQCIQRGEKVAYLETERCRKGGTIFPVLLTISPIRDDAGTVVGASTIVRDITRKRAAEAETQARRAAEEANRAKDEFLAMLSHELRNPLSAIIGWLAMLKGGKLTVERGRHALDVIERNARLEAELVKMLLDLSRIAANKLDLDKERVDLTSLVEIVVDSIRPEADAKGVALNVMAAAGSFIVVGDSCRLQQILSNLLNNALKFTPHGGHVQVRLARRESQAQIQVVDDGEGIPADFLPYIFDRFRQADSAEHRSHGGLGLGLAIVRELVNAHGGTVNVESQGKGKGSTFTVTFPIPAVIPDEIKAATVHFEPAEEPVISGLRILVVDDDADARELVALTLESRGAIVHLASSSAEALESMNRQNLDLMIADIGMPQEDGYALIQKLRGSESAHSQPTLPAIALTAYSSAVDRDQALAAGYDLHLTKPVAAFDLIHAVGKVSKLRSYPTYPSPAALDRVEQSA